MAKPNFNKRKNYVYTKKKSLSGLTPDLATNFGNNETSF